jgi:hypothetical protein
VPAPEVPRHRSLGAAAAGLVVLAVQLFYWLPNHATRDAADTDVPAFYRAAAHVVAHEPLYDEGIRHVQGTTATYIYPPPFAVLIAPLSRLGPARFQVAWYVGILLAFWLYAAALARLAAGALTAGGVFLSGVILQLCPGTSVTMSFGNADLLVWGLCALALKPPGGRLAGVAASFKVFPAWMLLTKRGADALAGVVAAAVLVGASALVVGVAGVTDWIRVAGVVAPGADWPTNVSLPHLVGYHGKAAPLFACVGAPLTAWLMRRRSRELAGAVVLVVAVFLSPICWWHYAPMLLMPFAALVAERRT